MKITFLGTGTSQGVPVIACECAVCKSTDPLDKRLRSSIMIEEHGITLIIDSGPDFRQQMLRENVKNIDGIIFTHEHKDHTGGLDDIRAFNYIKQGKLDIFAEERVQKSLRQEFAYVFAEKKYPGIPEVNMITISDNPFSVDGIDVIPIRTMHYYLPIFGFRVGNFCYITDTNFISEEEKKKIKGATHIVVSGLRKQKHLAHYTLNEAIALIQEMKPERGYITHCSHQLGLYKDIQRELPEGLVLAYDGLKIEI